MWWDRTQAYVQAFLAWKAEGTDENLLNAALALDDLLSEFQPYSTLLRLIHDDPVLQPLPEWSLLWPARQDGPPRGTDQVIPAEAVAFTQYATSQPRHPDHPCSQRRGGSPVAAGGVWQPSGRARGLAGKATNR